MGRKAKVLPASQGGGENLWGVFLHLKTFVLHLLVDHSELPLVPVSATSLQDGVINLPELEVCLEGQDTHLLVDVELPCPVEVQDGVEGARMSEG